MHNNGDTAMKTTIDAMKQLVCAWDEMMATHRPSALFEHVSALREAIAREEAQTVEPAFYVPPERNEYHSRDFVSASRTEKAGWVPLFTRPAPATETVKLPENCGTGHCSCIECVKPAKPSAGKRDALIHWLRERSMWDGMLRLGDAADMLAADAQEIEELESDYTDQVLRAMKAEEALAQQVAVPQEKQ